MTTLVLNWVSIFKRIVPFIKEVSEQHTQSSTTAFITYGLTYCGVSRENAMKTLVLIALIVALIVSLTQASNVHEDQRKSVDEIQDKDEASYASETERTEDDLSEDNAPDDVNDDEEDEEDEGDTQDEGAGDEEDFDDEEDLER